MRYKILEARIEYNDRCEIMRVTVLVDFSISTMPYNDVRALFATVKSTSPYMIIPPNAILSRELLEEVAGYGMQTVDRDEIFPKWKRKFKK